MSVVTTGDEIGWLSVREPEMTEVARPVFIIGGSRTGSEMLKTMLSMSSELDFVDEMFLLCPRWLHRDLNSELREKVGNLSAPGALDRVVDLVFSGEPYGWFWTVADKELDRSRLKAELAAEPLSLRSIFRAIMIVHAEGQGKSGFGAKFPLHYSRAELLLEWFPDCRLIHTTRNPKATYASQAAKYVRRDPSAASRAYMRFRQFVHINIQISWTASIHRRLNGLPNYRLVRYEDVVLQPEPSLRALCQFIGVDFVPEMMNPHQYGSSFDRIGGAKGIDPSSLERWKSTLHPLTVHLIELMHPAASSTLGY